MRIKDTVSTNLPARAWSSDLLSLIPVHGVGWLVSMSWEVSLSSVLKLCDDARAVFLTEGSS